MSTLIRRESRPFLDLFDWMDSPMTMFRPLLGQGMRMEDFVTDGHYVVRAELPGIDPEKRGRRFGQRRNPQHPRGAEGRGDRQDALRVPVRRLQPPDRAAGRR